MKQTVLYIKYKRTKLIKTLAQTQVYVTDKYLKNSVQLQFQNFRRANTKMEVSEITREIKGNHMTMPIKLVCTYMNL